MTNSELMREGIKRLKGAGIASPDFDARLLLENSLSLPPAFLLAKPDEPVLPPQQQIFLERVTARAQGQPLQYLLGQWEFYGMPFYVGPGVLIPRGDTETLVDCALAFAAESNWADKPLMALDLCAGSGCVGLALAAHLPQAHVHAIERSAEAFAYLERNIALNHAQNVTAIKQDVFDYLPGTPIDIIVSNPPYVRANQMQSLQKEVRFEPPEALLGGEDGLEFYRGIAKRYKSFLKPGGVLLFETGDGQADSVLAILEAEGYVHRSAAKDLNGLERVITGTVSM